MKKAINLLTLADGPNRVYEGGRADVKPYSTGPTGAFGAQIFKFEGVHLVRDGAPKEVCCNE